MGCSSTKAAKPQDKKVDNVSAAQQQGGADAAPAADNKDATKTLLKSIFEKVDKDADGKLDSKELAKALDADDTLEQLLEKAGYNPKFYVLEQLDGNEDGKVSWEEFQECLAPAAEEGAARPEAAVDAGEPATNDKEGEAGVQDAGAKEGEAAVDAKEVQEAAGAEEAAAEAAAATGAPAAAAPPTPVVRAAPEADGAVAPKGGCIC